MDVKSGFADLFDDVVKDEEEMEAHHFGRRIYHVPQRNAVNTWDDVDFFQRFRLSKTTFFYVLQLVGDELQHTRPRARYILPEQQLLITLRFMASGSLQTAAADVIHVSAADVIHVSAASVSRILPKVCIALNRHLNHFIKMPDTLTEREAAAAAFYRFAQFSRIIGAIYCTHVKVQSPGGQLSEGFRKRKRWFYINVQTISSANLRILNVVARWAGSTRHQKIFRHSNVRVRFEAGEFGNHILIGDSGYANTRYLATPYTANNSVIRGNSRMQLYQSRIIRSQNVVERQCGMWKRRFPVLAYGMRVKISTALQIITACAILHNICIDAKEPEPPENPEDEIRFRETIATGKIGSEIPDTPSSNRRNRQRNSEIFFCNC